MKKKSAVQILAVLVLLILLAGGGWYWLQHSPEPIEVKVIKADSGRISSRIRATGVVQSERVVHVSATQQGTVSLHGVKVGDVVKRGQLLMTIDDTEALAEIREQELKLKAAAMSVESARVQLRERQQDRNLGGGAQEAVRQARLKLSNEQLAWEQVSQRLDTLRMRLEHRKIKAPIDGMVIDRRVHEGEYVQEGAQMLVLASNTEREIMVKVEPDDASILEPGMRAQVVVESINEHPYNERLLRIEPVIKQEGAARYLPVWVSATDGNQSLRLNQQVDVNFDTRGQHADVRIPLEAVVSRNGLDQVWMIRQGRLVLKPVTLGALGDQYVELVSGLDSGDRVALLEGKDLTEGDIVTPISSSEGKP